MVRKGISERSLNAAVRASYTALLQHHLNRVRVLREYIRKIDEEEMENGRQQESTRK